MPTQEEVLAVLALKYALLSMITMSAGSVATQTTEMFKALADRIVAHEQH